MEAQTSCLPFGPVLIFRSCRPNTNGRHLPMTISEIREQLMHEDAEFQKLVQEHARYSTQLEQLSRSTYRSLEDLQLEAHLKRLKLKLKDQMESRIAHYTHAKAS